MYTTEYYSAIKKKEITQSAATWMQVEMILLSQVSQRNPNTTEHCLYVESKMRHRWAYLQNRNMLRDTENRLVVANGEGGGRVSESGIGRCNLWCREWIRDKVLLTSTGNYIEYPEGNHNGKELKECLYVNNWRKGCVCMCVCVHVHIYMYTYIQVYNGILVSHEKEWNLQRYGWI